MIKILYFGAVVELSGKQKEEIEGSMLEDVDSLRKHIQDQYKIASDFKLAVNKKIVEQNIKLNPGDEIAVMSPFSGG